MRPLVLLALCVSLAACDSPADVDSGPDSDHDAGPRTDAGPSAEVDAGPPTDAGPVEAIDAGPIGQDAGPLPADAGPLPTDAGPIDERPSSERHEQRPLGSTAAGQGYWEYLPPNYGNAPAPLMLFVHGLGENGNGDSELGRVARHGPPQLIEADEWPNDRPFVVLSTQRSGGGCTSASQIRDFLTYAMANYEIDPTRVYLTGLSCGAIGSFQYVAQNLDDDVIAAFVPIAGNGRPAWNAHMCDLGVLPIWAFHGTNDNTVPTAQTEEPMNSLLGCTDPEPADATLTLYPGVGHNSWTRTYDGSAGHDIYAWMLTHTNP